MDARINATLVTYAISGLKHSIFNGDITEKACLDVVKELPAFSKRNQSDALILDAVEKQLRLLHEQYPGEPLYYTSIGCGSGLSDSRIFKQLKQRLPDTELHIIGFDPYQLVANNPIVSENGGSIITHELAPGESYMDAIREQTDNPHPRVVAVERYSLHHMNRSIDSLLEKLEGAPLVSVDHPISKSQRESVAQRTAMIAYDLLANQVRTCVSKGSWIPSAMANPGLFNILYRREEDLRQQEKLGIGSQAVPGKNPPTWIIQYPENIVLSRAGTSVEPRASHISAAQNPPGGAWCADRATP